MFTCFTNVQYVIVLFFTEPTYDYSMSTTNELDDTSAIEEKQMELASNETPVDMDDAYNEFSAAINADTGSSIGNTGDDMDVNNMVMTEATSVMTEDNTNSNIASYVEGESNTANGVNDEKQDETSDDAGSKRKLEEDEVESSNMENTASDGGPSPPKKAHLDINVRKLLPDLEKHWKSVEDDPSDFTAWTYLLQYVDQEVITDSVFFVFSIFINEYIAQFAIVGLFASFDNTWE